MQQNLTIENQFMTQKDIRDSFAFKLSASKYHVSQIQKTFIAAKGDVESMSDTPKSRPIYYHYHAFIYELCSALEMTLHLLNAREKLGIIDKDVKWNDNFKDKLANKNSVVYDKLNDAFQSDWNKALRKARNQLLHRGLVELQVEYNDNQIKIVSPIVNGCVLHYDLLLFGEKIAEVFSSFYKE